MEFEEHKYNAAKHRFMSFREFKYKMGAYFFFGCPPFFILPFALKKEDKKVSKKEFCAMNIQSLVGYFATPLFWFGVSFGIAKHCFNEDEAEALAIGVCVASALWLVLMLTHNGTRIVKGRESDEAVDNLLFVQSVICPPLTFLGFVQAKLCEFFTGRDPLESF